MKHLITACFLILFAATAMWAQGTDKNSKSSPDETAIRQIVQQVQDGWNAHDGKAFAAPFATDADYVIVNGMHIRSRAEIETGHARIFASIYKDSRNQATIKSIRFLRPDIAVVHVEWNLEFSVDGASEKGHAMNSMILTKEGGTWSIAAFHNTPIQTPGPPSAK